jgi:hypothetical protein
MPYQDVQHGQHVDLIKNTPGIVVSGVQTMAAW